MQNRPELTFLMLPLVTVGLLVAATWPLWSQARALIDCVSHL